MLSKNAKFALFAIATLMGAVACSDSGPREMMMGAELPSMAACIASLEKNAGPLKVLDDSPDNMQCRTAADRGCGCRKMETATKGVYFEAWFMVPVQ